MTGGEGRDISWSCREAGGDRRPIETLAALFHIRRGDAMVFASSVTNKQTEHEFAHALVGPSADEVTKLRSPGGHSLRCSFLFREAHLAKLYVALWNDNAGGKRSSFRAQTSQIHSRDTGDIETK